MKSLMRHLWEHSPTVPRLLAVLCAQELWFGFFENGLGPPSFWDCTVSFPHQVPLSWDSVRQLQPASQLGRERVPSCPAVRFWDKWECPPCVWMQAVFKAWVRAWDLKNPFSFPFAGLFQRPELPASEPETLGWMEILVQQAQLSFVPPLTGLQSSNQLGTFAHACNVAVGI